MRRLLAASVAGFVLALCGLVATSLPAQACSCVAGRTLSQQAQRATDVLIGTVATPATTAGGSTTYDVRVERVFKGRATDEVSLRTPSVEASCGLTLAADRRYLVLGARSGQVVEVNSCGGTRPARTRVVDAVTAMYGAGRATTVPTQPAAPTYQTVEDRVDPGFARLAAPGAAVALVGFLGLMLVRRVGRPH